MRYLEQPSELLNLILLSDLTLRSPPTLWWRGGPLHIVNRSEIRRCRLALMLCCIAIKNCEAPHLWRHIDNRVFFGTNTLLHDYV